MKMIAILKQSILCVLIVFLIGLLTACQYSNLTTQPSSTVQSQFSDLPTTNRVWYHIDVVSGEGGTVVVSKDKAKPQDLITIVATPTDCNELESLFVEFNETSIPLSNSSFMMPEGDVKIIATFRLHDCTPPYDDVEGDLWIEHEMPSEGFVGRSIPLAYSLSHPDKPVRITSSNSSVATIQDGEIQLIAAGATLITIAYERLPYQRTFQLQVLSLLPIECKAPQTIDRGGWASLVITDPNDKHNLGLTYQSSDEMIASVSKSGTVFGHKIGRVQIIIVSNTTQEQVVIDIEIVSPKPNELIIDSLQTNYEVNQRVALNASILPLYAEGTIIGHTSNPAIIDIDTDLTLIIKDQPGDVTLTFTLMEEPSLVLTFHVSVYSPYRLSDFAKLIANATMMAKSITVYGYQFNYAYALRGSVIPLYTGQNSVQDAIIPIGNRNRLRIIAPIHYIVIHDTGSTASSANEYAHSNYVRNSDTTVSWHYTVGANAIYRHLPDEEQAIHAGDGGRVYRMLDSQIVATRQNPIVTVDTLGYFALDGVSSDVMAPMAGNQIAQTSHIVDSGIRIVIGENGNYWIGSTYFSGLSKIANTGGDKNGIGIEMTIHQGSDLFIAYQKLANLTASLLVLHRLTPDDVKQHNFFSGKNCPQTLRQASYWDAFMEMVQIEYIHQRYFPNHVVETVYIENEWTTPQGRLLRIPPSMTQIPYGMKIKLGTDVLFEETYVKTVR